MIHKFALPNTNTATIPDIANTLARRAMARGATIRLRTSTAMVPARENASGAVRNQPAPVAITVPQAVTRNRLLREVPSGAREQERDSGSSRLWWWGRNGARLAPPLQGRGERPARRAGPTVAVATSCAPPSAPPRWRLSMRSRQTRPITPQTSRRVGWTRYDGYFHKHMSKVCQ